MLNATFNLTRLLKENRTGSRATQDARIDTVSAFVNTLDREGFSRDIRKRDYRIQERHVARAVRAWQRFGAVSDRTIENRLAHLRSMARWQGTPGLLRSNREYLTDREQRREGPVESKAIDPSTVNPEAARTPFAQASLYLQKEFGLRRAEALKIQPWRSGDPETATHLVLHRSACKGGRPREILIRTEAQREAFRFAADVAQGGSLIPPGLKYAGKGESWRDEYRKEAALAGLPDGASHGLRHAYAQARYVGLTAELSGGEGWKAPVNGGPWRSEMTPEDAAVDRLARQVVAEELGHGKARRASAYLGGLAPSERKEEGNEDRV